jgi:predicted transposase YdaD
MAKKADILWKAIIEEVFEDFLMFIYPGAREIIDFSKEVQFLDKEMDQLFPPEGNHYTPKVVDKLVKLYTRNGAEELVLVHLEVQGQYNESFNERMFSYYSRIFDKYRKPITAFVIFTEPFLVNRTNQYERNFMGTRLLYQFNTLKISHQKDEDLLASDNPFALVVLSAKTAFSRKKIKTKEERDKVLRDLKLSIVKALHNKDYPQQKINKIMKFLRFYVNFETKEINDIFEQDIQLITEKTTTTMGIDELLIAMAEDRGAKKAEKKAEAQANRKALAEKKAIARNFKKLGVAIPDIAKGVGLTVEEIERL